MAASAAKAWPASAGSSLAAGSLSVSASIFLLTLEVSVADAFLASAGSTLQTVAAAVALSTPPVVLKHRLFTAA